MKRRGWFEESRGLARRLMQGVCRPCRVPAGESNADAPSRPEISLSEAPTHMVAATVQAAVAQQQAAVVKEIVTVPADAAPQCPKCGRELTTYVEPNGGTIVLCSNICFVKVVGGTTKAPELPVAR